MWLCAPIGLRQYGNELSMRLVLWQAIVTALIVCDICCLRIEPISICKCSGV